MDKNSIVDFFVNNTRRKQDLRNDSLRFQVKNGNVFINYGDNATINSGCSIDDNQNLTTQDKKELHEMIEIMEKRNREG